MSAHTPGPWVVCNSTDVFTPLGAARADGLVADSSDGWKIADCDIGLTLTELVGQRLPLTYAEMRANARLIAAAPDYAQATADILKAVANNAAPVNPMAALREMAITDSHITLHPDLLIALFEAHAKATGVNP